MSFASNHAALGAITMLILMHWGRTGAPVYEGSPCRGRGIDDRSFRGFLRARTN